MYVVKRSRFGLGVFIGSTLAVGALTAAAMSCPKMRRVVFKWIGKGKRLAQNGGILL